MKVFVLAALIFSLFAINVSAWPMYRSFRNAFNWPSEVPIIRVTNSFLDSSAPTVFASTLKPAPQLLVPSPTVVTRPIVLPATTTPATPTSTATVLATSVTASASEGQFSWRRFFHWIPWHLFPFNRLSN